MEKNVIFNGDCLDFINRLDYKFNLVVTSPPYNTCRNLTSERARKNHEGRYDIYQEEKTNNEYDDWVVNIFNAIDGKLEENGCVIWNVSYGTENPTQMWTSITAVCEKTNFIIADTIIWKKKTALPNNVSPNKLTRICEFIFICYANNKKILTTDFKDFQELNFEELKEVFNKLNLDNKSILIMKPLEEKE